MNVQEIIGYVVIFITWCLIVIFTLGLFGAFDDDKDNPFKNSK